MSVVGNVGSDLEQKGQQDVCASSETTDCSIRVGTLDLHGGGTESAGKLQAVASTEGYRDKHWPDEELTGDFKLRG